MWQAVLFQDTFLTVILKLPPTATHTDVRVEDLGLEVEESLTESGATGEHLAHIVFAPSTEVMTIVFLGLKIFSAVRRYLLS